MRYDTPSLSGMLNMTHEVLECLCLNKQLLRKHTFCKIFTLQLREKCRINEIIADVTVMPLCCNDAIEFSCHSSHLRLSLERCYNVAGGDIYGVALKVLRVLSMCIPFSLALFFS